MVQLDLKQVGIISSIHTNMVWICREKIQANIHLATMAQYNFNLPFYQFVLTAPHRTQAQ